MSCRTIGWAALGVACAMVASAPAAADEEASALVQQMIAAHGGMDKWQSAPSVYFEEQWESGGPVAQITVEQGRRRVYHDYPDTHATIVFDGTRTWSTNWTEKTPPRFLATLNYYFLNLPWLAMDPGVKLAAEGMRTIHGSDKKYHAVRMTFEVGTGDTPDDYYVLYIDPDTKMLKACEYIVTYASLLPEGMTHTPPKLLVYDAFSTVGGLQVPTQFTIYREDSQVYAACTIRNWSFSKPFDETRMTMPADAVIDESKP